MECAIDSPEAEAQVGTSFPDAWGTLSPVSLAVERASRSWNLGRLSIGGHLTSYLSRIQNQSISWPYSQLTVPNHFSILERSF